MCRYVCERERESEKARGLVWSWVDMNERLCKNTSIYGPALPSYSSCLSLSVGNKARGINRVFHSPQPFGRFIDDEDGDDVDDDGLETTMNEWQWKKLRRPSLVKRISRLFPAFPLSSFLTLFSSNKRSSFLNYQPSTFFISSLLVVFSGVTNAHGL